MIPKGLKYTALGVGIGIGVLGTRFYDVVTRESCGCANSELVAPNTNSVKQPSDETLTEIGNQI